jgi:hypothetical protein
VRSADVEASVFKKSCAFTSCHIGNGAGGLSLEGSTLAKLVNVRSVQDPTRTLVVPGAPEKSWLYVKLLPNPPVGSQMPSGDAVTAEQLDLVRRWIADGAQ